jgi:hypothetical protein
MSRNLWIAVVAIALVIWLMNASARAAEIATLKAGLGPDTTFNPAIDLAPV